MGDEGEIMAGRVGWRRTYAWLCVIVGGGSKIMAGRGWLWIVVDGRGW